MPTYTYRCTKCGEEYEAFQSMSDPPLKRCKKCRGALRRTFHPVGIVLKGSGFHKTDYRSKASSSERERKDSEGSTKSDGSAKKDAPKTESKTESKSSKSSESGSAASSDS